MERDLQLIWNTIRKNSQDINDGSLISTPYVSPSGTIPQNIINYNSSYGYDCTKYYNLYQIYPKILVFVSGNLLHFFNVTTKEIVTRRSVLGSGIGCISINPNPNSKHLCVAEDGDEPIIFIYNFPSLKIISKLYDGAGKCYSRLTYNVEGNLLASQSGEPDYKITIWDYEKQQIILRTQSYSNDVLNVKFSQYSPGQITTCGLGHIKFWKMCETFTGLKLIGDLGRFGKTEICNILGLCPMPDETVLSGCEWGNILVWEGGLIKYEICRKNRMKCHIGPITEIRLREGEVMTVGLDGYVRIWFWETVEVADPPDDDRFVEIEPIYEYFISDDNDIDSQLMTLVKCVPENNQDYKWYAQDGKGGIWICDISPEPRPEPPIRLFRCHSGEVIAADTSPFSNHIATLGRDGYLFIYDYDMRNLIFYHKFSARGCDLIWLPINVESSGCGIVLGFDDGFIRLILVNLSGDSLKSNHIKIIQIIKSHKKAISKLSINPKQTILVSGSFDQTIFVHQLSRNGSFVSITPIGLVQLSSSATAINWMPNMSATILLGCLLGQIIKINLPETPRAYTDISYNLSHVEITEIKFLSKKSEIKRNMKIEEVALRKAQKMNKKKNELETLKAKNIGRDIDEEQFLAELSESDEELEPLYVPLIPNRILWLELTPNNTIWVSVAGYDAGYLYEYNFEHNDPIKCVAVPKADNIEIHSYLYFQDYLLFGMGDGKLRIIKTKEDYRNLNDYWQLGMHDNKNGTISRLCMSYDQKYLFSIGFDGNLFAYEWNLPFIDVDNPTVTPIDQSKIIQIPDIDDPMYLSLEEEKQKSNKDERFKYASEKKQKILDLVSLYKIQYADVLKQNKKLPLSQQLTDKEMELDSRIITELIESLKGKMCLVKRKMAFDVEKSKLLCRKITNYFIDPMHRFPIEISGLKIRTKISTFRMMKLGNDFFDCHQELNLKMNEEKQKRRKIEVPQLRRAMGDQIQSQKIESFLQGLQENKGSYNLQTRLKRLLKKYRDRKNKEQNRKLEWEYVNSQKPNPNVNHPDDIQDILEAKNTIGDYKLKIDPQFTPSEDGDDTLINKYKELLRVRKEIFDIQKNFNNSVFKLRSQKQQLIEDIRKVQKLLEEIHKELPENEHLNIPEFNEIDEKIEFPEKSLETIDEPSESREVETLLRRFSTEPLQSSIHLLKPKGAVARYGQALIDMDQIKNRPIQLMSPNDKQKKNFKIKNSRSLLELTQHDKESIWDTELRSLRKSHKIVEQKNLIETIEKRIKQFDNELLKLAETKIQVEIDTKFLETYFLTINQELCIIRDFEELEKKLVDKVEATTIENNKLLANIMFMETELDDKKREIDQLMEKEKLIQQKFSSNCFGNKFTEFFKRIFKKKYKPPKITENSESSSDENSSSSEDNDDDDDADMEDDASLNTADIPIRTDENICPPGCDRHLYELVFILRSERHSTELQLKEENKNVETMKKELENLTNKIKDVQNDLNKYEMELVDLRRQKQKELNEVKTLVILRMDQLQYFQDESDFYNIEDTLLFSHVNVAKLYARVGQLALETLETKRRHRVNVVHLSRMKTDCHFMEEQIVQLKDEIKTTMRKKFGMSINLDELQETILKQFVYEIQLNFDEIDAEYRKKVANEKKILAAKQIEYTRVVQEGTEKLNILTVLQEEQNLLNAIFQNKAKKKEKNLKIPKYDFSHDLAKLREISKQQKEQIEALQREIRTLSLKCKPFGRLDQQEHFDMNTSRQQDPNFVDKDYEDSVFTNIEESVPTSPRPNSPNLQLLNDMTNIVNKFLKKTLKTEMSEVQMKKSGYQISRYLVNAAKSFDYQNSEELLSIVIKEFHKFLPKQVWSKIPPKELANLIENVVKMFQSDEAEAELKDVVNGIIENALEIINSLQYESFVESLLTEIFSNLFVTLNISDLKADIYLDYLVDGLIKMKEINIQCINVQPIVKDVHQFIYVTLNEDVDHEVITTAIETFVKKFKEKLLTKK